jgi:hypothetical protein
LLYIATVIWGGTLIPTYSHVAEPISGLVQSGRQGTEGIQGLFAVYNAMVIWFGCTGISLKLSQRYWTSAFGFVVMTGLLGLAMWPFPMDPMGNQPTAGGVIHILLAGFSSLASMAAIGFSIFAWKAAPQGIGPAIFSGACLVVVFVSGAMAAIGVAVGWHAVGVYERVTIGTFLTWMLVTAILFLLDRRRPARPSLVQLRPWP